MTHLQHFHGCERREQIPFHDRAHVAGQQRIEAAVSQMHNQGVLVGGKLPSHPRLTRMEHGERDRIDRHGVARTAHPPRHPQPLNRREIVQVEIGADGLARLHDERHVE
jgi:hypothetical protein